MSVMMERYLRRAGISTPMGRVLDEAVMTEAVMTEAATTAGLAKLEKLAQKAVQAAGLDVKKVKVWAMKGQPNLVNVRLAAEPTGGTGYLSFGGHLTGAGQARQDNDRKSNIAFEALKRALPKAGFKIEDASIDFDRGAWVAFFVSDQFA